MPIPSHPSSSQRRAQRTVAPGKARRTVQNSTPRVAMATASHPRPGGPGEGGSAPRQGQGNTSSLRTPAHDENGGCGERWGDRARLFARIATPHRHRAPTLGGIAASGRASERAADPAVPRPGAMTSFAHRGRRREGYLPGRALRGRGAGHKLRRRGRTRDLPGDRRRGHLHRRRPDRGDEVWRAKSPTVADDVGRSVLDACRLVAERRRHDHRGAAPEGRADSGSGRRRSPTCWRRARACRVGLDHDRRVRGSAPHGQGAAGQRRGMVCPTPKPWSPGCASPASTNGSTVTAGCWWPLDPAEAVRAARRLVAEQGVDLAGGVVAVVVPQSPSRGAGDRRHPRRPPGCPGRVRAPPCSRPSGSSSGPPTPS